MMGLFAAVHESGFVMVFGRRQQGGVPHAQLTGVPKAPRHEVAGSWAPAEQRALWGFNAGAELDDRCESDRFRPTRLDVREVGRVQ